jgi:hypothetical protein
MMSASTRVWPLPREVRLGCGVCFCHRELLFSLTGLRSTVSWGRDDDDGTDRMVDALLTDRAEQQALEAAQTARADDELRRLSIRTPQVPQNVLGNPAWLNRFRAPADPY